MIGSLDPKIKDVHVVGGGISGLLIADRLDRLGWRVTLSESSTRLGGLIQTQTSSYGMTESAAHSLMASPAVRAYLEELGVATLPTFEHARARWIIRDARLRRFPLTVFEAIAVVLRAYFVRAPRSVRIDECSLEEWTHRHLGEAAHDYLIQPMVEGIFASHPRQLLVGRVFPKLWIEAGQSLVSQLLRNRWKKKRAPSPQRTEMVVPQKGMQELVNRLEARLKLRLGDRLRLGKSVTAAELQSRDTNWVLTAPAFQTADLLQTIDLKSSQALIQLPYAPLVSVSVFFESREISHVKPGVGYLSPRRENRDVLGVLMPSLSFGNRASPGFDALTVMLGGTHRPDWVNRPDSEIQSAIRAELAQTLDISAEPVDWKIHRWPHAIPRYGVERESAVQLLEQGYCSQPGRMLFSNWSGQVSIRGMIETLSDYGIKPCSS